ncbi:hypothetical protein MHY85_06940 [Cellulomonas sp. ACRRI]|uniref:hypothetical protein n=1 Tax=Cellulomonas sp. ACRRI TaxID=2918188 RepID=UPI001EF2717A|nr:hypothetical protein [Cellulomonas sp. ACRRI]MCG7285707.1 hypothetical protein [Cellulomonas sp. ACRRI]
MTTRRTFLAAAAAVPALVAAAPDAVVGVPGPAGTASAPGPAGGTQAPPGARLANPAHLRFLLDTVPLAAVDAHTTYRIAEEPTALAPWTYADADGGTFRRVGGGTLDPATGHWSQGAYNADDIARAAVALLRDWRAAGDAESRQQAYQLLRALTYLQDDSGPHAGRVVLWQQPDGALNPSAEPVELPDPSNSAESYWLARTVWALGEGYAAFAADDPAFAQFLLDRLHLAVGALEQESLSRYGRRVRSDGVPLPDWLIAGGADATAEAVLGLVAAVRVLPRDRQLSRALDRYAEGVAALGTTDTRRWPFGAVLPWTGSLGFWHAWGAAAPEALAAAGALRGRRDWARAALADAGTFTPLVLATGGPFNAWTPTPGEAQIAYGAHGRVAAALAAADAGGGEGLRVLGGLAAGWFFGANPAGVPVYDPATGVTFDGVETDGRVNRNSGAESTIHGLLAMQLLDARPDVAAVARSITGLAGHDGLRVLDAEAARLGPGCEVVRPAGGAWTGEGNLVGGGYVRVPPGSAVEFDVPAAAGAWALPLVWRTAAPAGRARWEVVGGPRLGRTENGGTGAAGLTEADGSLVPQLLDRPLAGGASSGGTVTVRCANEGAGDLRLDALLVRPAVATARWSTTTGTDAVLYAGSTARGTTAPALAAGSGAAYLPDGRVDRRVAAPGPGVAVPVPAGGFTVTR